MARGYAKSRQITVLITQSLGMLGSSNRQNIIKCKCTALIGQTIVEDHAQRHDDKHG